MKKQLLCTLLITILTVVTGFSQVTTSKIDGLVIDENSEGLFGANVVVVHEPTGTV